MPEWLKKLAYKVGGIFRFFKKRYSLEHAFQLLGGFLGFFISLALLIGGIAAVPFTGGASLVPVWVGWLIFVGLVTTTTLAFGRFFGITLDTMISSQKSNNEKLATVAAFVVSMLIAGLASPLAYASAPFLNVFAYKSPWGMMVAFFISTSQSITSIGRHIGRTVDKHFDQKTLPDRFKKIGAYIQNTFGLGNEEAQEVIAEDMHADIANQARNATAGIIDYLQQPREGQGSHLSPSSQLFDYKAGTRRGIVLLKLMGALEIEEQALREAALKEELLQEAANNGMNLGRIELRVEEMRQKNCNLQKAIILYTMLGAAEGRKLKKMVCEKMGYRKKMNADDGDGYDKPVEAAQQFFGRYIRQQLAVRANNDRVLIKKNMEYLVSHVICKLGLYFDNNKRLYKAKEQEEIAEVKDLNRQDAAFDAKKLRAEYADVWNQLHDPRFSN